MKLVFYLCAFLLLYSNPSLCLSGDSDPNHSFLLTKLKEIDKIIHKYLDAERNPTTTPLPITTAKATTTTTPRPTTNTPSKLLDCKEIRDRGNRNSGIYVVQPSNRYTQPLSFQVYCDMETDGGGWTVFQRRGSYGNQKDYFFKNWKSYSDGFGKLDQEFWLGNDKLHSLTNQGNYMLRIDMKDQQGNKRYAKYSQFRIGSEGQSYPLHVSGYSGDAGDALKYHSDTKFSAMDRDNDGGSQINCASAYKGGWWYKNDFCYNSNLNGFYASNSWEGIIWYGIKNDWLHSLPYVEMKIRRA